MFPLQRRFYHGSVVKVGILTRRTHSPALKVKVALTVLKVEKQLVALSKLFDVYPRQFKGC